MAPSEKFDALRDVSGHILAELDVLRQLEVESRKVPVGSPEFRRISAEIEARSRAIFGMTREQRSLAEAVPPEGRALDDADEPVTGR